MNPEDTSQLNLLAVFHYVVGGIMAFFSCIPFIHVFMGLAIVSGRFFEEADGTPPPEPIGWIFIIMGSIFILLGWITATCIVIAGRKLSRRKNRMFCMVIAAIECTFMPFGTVLGVFTLIALNKESIKAGFQPATPQNGSRRNLT